MSQTPVVCPKQPLPRDLDVEIVISRPLTEIATDMTLMCFLTDETPFPPNNDRVRYYSTFDSVVEDFPVGSEGWFAANAFFSRQVHPRTMAIGAVFLDPVPAGLIAGDLRLTNLSAITDGAFGIDINGAVVEISGLDFTAADTLAEVATVINTAFNGAAKAEVKYGTLFISTLTTGDGNTLSYAEAPTAGTDVSELLGLTKNKGASLWQGYSPKDLVSEADMVGVASRCNSRPIYGWTIDRKWRDTDDQKSFADWAEAKVPAYFSACTNSVSAYNSADTTNIGYYAQNKGYRRTSTIYHDNQQVYPDVSYIAFALATNYSLPDSAITMKFKQLEGIEPSVISQTQLAVLESRNINCYVAIGNTSRTVREGVQGADTWFTDTLVNLDNFREELQVEVYNVFLRNKKVPYTTAGQDKLVSAAKKICNKYTRNGVFAPRDIESDTVESGFVTLPATNIVPVPVAFATTSERAARIAPPIKIDAYEAGAFHRVSINVDVYN